MKKLQLWADDGVFEDPITKAEGRKQYEPQWVHPSLPFILPSTNLFIQYGLQTAFKEIERLHHEVTSAGNPIQMDLKTRYVTKVIGKEQTIASKINIFYDKSTGKITKVEDKWDGNLPDSSFTNVSVEQLFSPWWWVHYGEGWAWWMWSWTWDTWWWQVRGVSPLACHRLTGTRYGRDVGIPADLFGRFSASSTPLPCPRWSASLRTTRRMRRRETSSSCGYLMSSNCQSTARFLYL